MLLYFKISLSTCSLVVYTKYNWFLYFYLVSCLLVLHRSFAKRDSFILICMSFIFFSCVIVLAKTSSTMLNSHGESGHLCFVFNLRENAFSLSSLSIMLAIGFVMFYFCRCSLSS